MEILLVNQLPDAERFVIEMGVWDNFTVAGGQDTQAWTRRSRLAAEQAVSALMSAITRDHDLLQYDYTYKLPWERGYTKGMSSSFGYAGKLGFIKGGAGQLELTLMETGEDGVGRLCGKLDLRPPARYVTDSGGEIMIKREAAELGWADTLPELHQFLRSLSEELIEVRHHHEGG